MSQLNLELPDSISADEARFELAVALYRSGRITQGEAANLAQLSRPTFLELLGKKRESFTNLQAQDLEEEFETWRSLPSPTRPPSSTITL